MSKEEEALSLLRHVRKNSRYLGDDRLHIHRDVSKAIELLESEKKPEQGGFTSKIRENWPADKKFNWGWLADNLSMALDIIDMQEAENKALKRPMEATGFKTDGMLAVGNELIDRDNKIKELQEELKDKEIDIECLTAERDSYFEEYHNLQAKLKAKDTEIARLDGICEAREEKRLSEQSVKINSENECCVLRRQIDRLGEELKGKDEIKPKPLLFGHLHSFNIIISELVPEGQIWFATKEQLDQALEYSMNQIEKILKGQGLSRP